MSAVELTRSEAGRRILAYLAETDPLPATPVDAVIGFGMFDLSLPRLCGDLLAQGMARRIIFTGGIGAGTGNLGGPEAEAWRVELRRSHPEITDEQLVVESRSTNTAENIAFTAELLAQKHPELAFGHGLRSAIVVASPSRLRRVGLTLRLQQPNLHVIRHVAPTVSIAQEAALYEQNGTDYISHLVGELDRIQQYPARGWIAAEALPAAIVDAQDLLRRSLPT